MKIFNKKLAVVLVFVLAGALLFTGLTQAKGITLKGVVKNNSGTPIENLKVFVENTSKQTITNSDGEFTLSNVEVGPQVLKITGDKGTGKVSINVTEEMDRVNIKYPVITKIAILHANDAHGTIKPLAKIAYKVNQLEKKYDDVFVVNAGDVFSGNPVVDQYDPKGYPMIALMNDVGFDVMAIGNHEFDYGQKVLNKRIKQAKFDFISANFDTSNATLNQPDPYVTLKTNNNLKVSFLGLIQVDSKTGIPSTHPAKLEGIDFSDPLTIAKDYANLKENNIFLALSHLGNNLDNELAKEMGELDVIIGGHSHTSVSKPSETNGVLITQAGDDYNYLGKVVVTLKNGKIINKTGTLINVEDIKGSDSEIASKIKEFQSKSNLDQVIGTASSPINGKDELGSLMTDAVTNYHNLDIAFQNNGGIRVDALKGDITLKDIYQLAPFGNSIIKYEMTPDEIRSLIKYSFKKESSIDLQVSGIEYIVKVNQVGEVDGIELTDYNGNPISEDKTYKVGLNSYIASSYEFKNSDEGQNLYMTMANTIIEYIKSGGNLDYDGKDRTHKKTVSGGKGTTIGYTNVTIDAEGKTKHSTPAGNLITDAIRKHTGADIATFPAYNGLNEGTTIKPGVVYKETLSLMYSKYFDENKAIVGKIKGSDLKKFILNRCKKYDNIDLEVSGLNYTISTNDSGQVTGITITMPDGSAIQADKTYTVTFNNYQFGNNYNLDDVVEVIKTTKATEKEMLINYVKNTYSQSNPIDSEITENRSIIE